MHALRMVSETCMYFLSGWNMCERYQIEAQYCKAVFIPNNNNNNNSNKPTKQYLGKLYENRHVRIDHSLTVPIIFIGLCWIL